MSPARLALACLALLFGTAMASAQPTPPLLREPIASIQPKPRAVVVPRAPTMQVPAPPTITPVSYQRSNFGRQTYPTARDGSTEDTRLEYQIQLEPPGLERLAGVMENDPDLQERIRQETLRRDPNERVVFPEEPILSRDRYYGRGGIWPQRGMIVEPNYVCFGKLYFEDKNAERYGWELGHLQPMVSTALFFADVACLPKHMFTDPCNKNDCSAGHCLPGDPVPFRLYPPEITASGTAAELLAILALIVIFP